MSRELTQNEVGHVKAALQAARKGGATLEQLAHAHRLAEDACLNGTVGELREHIHRVTPQPPLRMEARSIFLGVMSGIVTHYIFKWSERPSRHNSQVAPIQGED